MKIVKKTVEEVQLFIEPLLNDHVVDVIKMENGEFEVQWIKIKSYTAADGQEFPDEVWTTHDGEMKLIQDLGPEHAKNIIRMMIRRQKAAYERMESFSEEIAQGILDALEQARDGGSEGRDTDRILH
jgi:hypothetical protein